MSAFCFDIIDNYHKVANIIDYRMRLGKNIDNSRGIVIGNLNFQACACTLHPDKLVCSTLNLKTDAARPSSREQQATSTALDWFHEKLQTFGCFLATHLEAWALLPYKGFPEVCTNHDPLENHSHAIELIKWVVMILLINN